MLIFIDESGDTGFKINEGSSRIFVMSAVIFENESDAEETALVIRNFRRKINKTNRFEFKFNKANRGLRIGFLQAVRNCNFKIRSVIFYKNRINNTSFFTSSDGFYNYVLRQVVGYEDAILNAKISIDGCGNKKFRMNLVKYLKFHLNSNSRKTIKTLKFVDSNKDVLIQLADMVAGSIKKSCESKSDNDKEYRKILSDKEVLTWENT